MLGAIDHGLRLRMRFAGYRSRYVTGRQGRWHALDGTGTGSLPTCVLLHGLSASASGYGPTLSLWRRHFRRVLAPELPGHGFSDSPRSGMTTAALLDSLVEVLDELVPEPMWLVGSSMGASAAVRYALRRPERVAGLALVAPAGAPMSDDEFAGFLRQFHMPRLRDGVAFVDRLFAEPFPFRRVYGWGVRQSFRRPSIRELIANLSPGDALEPEELAELPMPVQVIWGPADGIFPLPMLDFFRANLPANSQVEVPSGFGHVPFMDRLDDLTRRIVTFATARCPDHLQEQRLAARPRPALRRAVALASLAASVVGLKGHSD